MKLCLYINANKFLTENKKQINDNKAGAPYYKTKT